MAEALPLVEELQRWFAGEARDLPWRRPGIPAWQVLVSEIMLQQTPVARVLPQYLAWLQRWPGPADLAADSVGEAVRMWGKLGYPRRAVRLHACAVLVTEEHGGEVPDQLEQLLALPGVGSYTARAVLAFAFGRRAAVVDTNVRRVLARAVDGAGDPGVVSQSRDLRTMEAVLPIDDAGAVLFCAATMELGAVVCTAARPGCARCPIQDSCAWRRAGYPTYEGPIAPPQRFTGTDRQVRGLLLDVLRDTRTAVDRQRLDAVWPLAEQRSRALASLIADGLVQQCSDGRYALPS